MNEPTPRLNPKGTALAVWGVYGFVRPRIVTAGIFFPRHFNVFIPPHPDLERRLAR